MARASGNSLCDISFMSFGDRVTNTESAGIYDIQSIIYSKMVYLRCDMIGLKGCASRSESNRSVHLYKLATHIGVGEWG